MRWLVLTVLLCGCLTQTAVVERYVCADGWVVDNTSKCVGRTPECPACETAECPECRCPQCESDVKLEYKAEARQAPSTTLPPGTDPCVRLGCPPGAKYAASRNSGKYHLCECEWASKISEKNLLCYKNMEEAESDNKTACKICIGGL